jgi:hypothetical protein
MECKNGYAKDQSGLEAVEKNMEWRRRLKGFTQRRNGNAGPGREVGEKEGGKHERGA